ncbi:hypothetical protein BC830DRAFT_847357 [Chytriomyces sp. MP71]|nr:hypothetical protein BC830DRAFT_847357 [Chytriomyces sp. MP71]
MEDSSKLTTFIHYDFFEFETQVSPMGIGQRPVYNCTSKFKVYTDDFFLQYLQSKNTVFYLALSNGLDSFTIATCSVIMKELTDPDRTDRLRYYADLISTHDGRAIIGKVDFGLRVRLPMAQAIRSFKERTVALNLLTVSDKEVSSRRFRPRADTNDLVIRIINCKNLRKPPGRSPAVFASFQFYIHESIVTDTVVNSTSPLFNFLRILPLPMTSDLDRYLRTAFMTIVVLDDNDGIDDFEYGSCTVPLLPLALGEKIYEEYFLSDGYGSDKSKITLSFEWSKPYKLNVVPLISQLDDQIRSSSGRSHKAAHSQDDDETESHDTSRHERARSDRGSEDMDKYHELNVDKLGQRSRHDSTESSRRTTTTEIPSTNDRISTTSVTTSTTDLRQKSRSDPALSTIDEHENGHRSRDSEQSDEEQREKEENERDRKSSKYSLSNKRSSKELALSSKGTSHESILSKYSKHEEDDEKRDKENGRPSSPKSKSLEDVKRSKKIADPRKKTSHKSLDHLGERKLSKDSHESLKPGENGRDQEDLGTRKSSHPSVKQEAGSHKSSHTSVKEKTNKNKEDLGSRKSSHKSLNGEKKKSDGLGSRKSSHKSVKEDEDESEKKSSREASKNSLKKSSDSVHNHHKSKDSVKKSQDSLKKSKEHLSSSDGSTGSDSDGESHSTSGKTGDDTTSEVSESASSSIKSDTSKQSSPLSKTSSASSKSKSSENRSEEEDSELSDSGTATPKYHRSSEETVQSHIRDSESKSSSNESGSKNAESDSGTKELKSESGSKDSETGSRKSLSQSGSRSNNTSNESFHSANVSLTSKLSSESDSSSTVRAGRRGEQKELGSHDSFEQSSDHRTSSSSILSKVDRNLYGHSEEEEETSKETTTSSATQKESDSSRRSRDRTDEEEESNTDDIHFTSDDTHRRSDSETSNSHDGPSNFFKLQIDKVLFKTSSPKTMRLLESVYQFFVSFEFLNCPAEELETHSVERNDTGSHSLNFSKKFPMHPFKDERNRFALTRKLNSRDKRDATILFTIVSEPTEESEADAECEDIAYAKLDLMEVAHEGKDSVRRELQIWDPNGDILMGTMVIHLKGCSILSECLND